MSQFPCGLPKIAEHGQVDHLREWSHSVKNSARRPTPSHHEEASRLTKSTRACGRADSAFLWYLKKTWPAGPVPSLAFVTRTMPGGYGIPPTGPVWPC